jgi:hypothetical protein
MNGRVQDAITGRFLSADPYGTEMGMTQSFNRYSYVINNPMSYTDPSGFKWQQVCVGVGDQPADCHSEWTGNPLYNFVAEMFGIGNVGPDSPAAGPSEGPTGPAADTEGKKTDSQIEQCLKNAQPLINAGSAFIGGTTGALIATEHPLLAVGVGAIAALSSGLADLAGGGQGNGLALAAAGAGAALVTIMGGGGACGYKAWLQLADKATGLLYTAVVKPLRVGESWGMERGR